MREIVNLNCFIAAPVNVDTSALRNALERQSIRWTDVTSVKPGLSIINTIESAIRHSDFICVVIPQDAKVSNVYFELGLARGFRKPVLLFIEPGVDIVTDIGQIDYVRAAVDDQQVIDFNLDVFLDHFSRKFKNRPKKLAAKRGRINVKWTMDKLASIWEISPNIAGQTFEKLVARLFEQAGAIVTRQPKHYDRGADMAIWLDEVQSSLGNPLLVEVKFGRITNSMLNEAEEGLRSLISKGHARAGFLIYLDRERQHFAKTRRYWPLVIRLDAYELVELISHNELVNTLLQERNQVAHQRTR